MIFLLLTLPACSSRPPAHLNPIDRVRVDTPSRLATRIDSLVDDSVLAHSFVGIRIISLKDKAILYERNSSRLFHPASNQKLLTTAAAIHVLGRAFRFQTQIVTDGVAANGVLRGNLCIKSCGDPMLGTSDFDSVAEQLSEKGIHVITGNLVGDASYFDTLSWGRGWMWDDEPEADEAFLSSMTVNGNSVDLEIGPGDHSGIRGSVALNPPTSYVTIRNSSMTTSDTLVPPLTVARAHGENAIRIDGRIAPGSQYRRFPISVSRPERYFLHHLRERLALHGITIQDSDKIEPARGTTLLCNIQHPIDSVIHRVNKVSDNIAAENLLKTIGAEHFGVPGTARSGLACVKGYLDTIGIDTTSMSVVDGSGVSWYNLVSPAAMVRLLEAEYSNRETFGAFYESLPIAGVDGTLKNRMIGTRAANNVRGKTGSLTGESCLSGFVTSADGSLLAFCIFCNHFAGETASLRSVQDSILTLLARYDSRHP